ncbi:MAG TPA: nucleotide-binding protein [Acidimicrobiales bacterium]|jgi:predicted nucleotide-binding protein
MARTRGTTPEPAKALLRWRRERLRRELAEQLTVGNGLTNMLSGRVLQGIGYQNPEEWRVTPEGWHQRNRTILDQAFTTTQVRDEYDRRPRARVLNVDAYKGDPLRMEQIAALRKAHEQRLSRLRDIQGRLDVYDEDRQAPDFDTANNDVLASDGRLVFIVHGHDDHTKQLVARTLHQLTGDEPVILHEMPNAGQTIIEKLERHAGLAAAAVVILSPDDAGAKAPAGEDEPALRARQNVVYELGWFHGRLGRGKVVALLVGDVEQLSDLSGVLYIPVDPGGAWRYQLGHELREAGLEVDLDKVRH